MADDSYSPSFAEYIGKSIAEAMEDENPVYEQIAGENTTFSFSTIETNLAEVQGFVINGVFQDTEHVLWLPTTVQNNQLIATYLGKVISAEKDGFYRTSLFPASGVQEMIDGNETFGDLLNYLNTGPAVTDFVVDGTRLTLDDIISPNDVPQTALQKIGVLPEYVRSYQ